MFFQFRERTLAAFSRRSHGADNRTSPPRFGIRVRAQLVPRKICAPVNNARPWSGEAHIDHSWRHYRLASAESYPVYPRRRTHTIVAVVVVIIGGGQSLLLGSGSYPEFCLRARYLRLPRVIGCVPGPRPKEHLKRGPGCDYRVSKIIMLRSDLSRASPVLNGEWYWYDLAAIFAGKATREFARPCVRACVRERILVTR